MYYNRNTLPASLLTADSHRTENSNAFFFFFLIQTVICFLNGLICTILTAGFHPSPGDTFSTTIQCLAKQAVTRPFKLNFFIQVYTS